MYNLKHLLSPFSKDEFLDDYSGTKSLFVEGEKEKFSGLFSWKDASKILKYQRNTMEGFRLVYDKKPLPPEALPEYVAWLEKGATLVINNLDKVHPSMFAFSNSLALELNTTVNINCYMSYPESQGFDTHYDQHDVFIVQLEGTKVWTIYEQTVNHPTHIMGKPNEFPPDAKPYLEFEMSPGDIAYIPRGHWHHAVASSPSMHLTVGPSERSAIHFMEHVVQKLLNNDEWYRRDFPFAEARELGGYRQGLEEHFQEFVDRTIKIFKSEALFESLLEYAQISNSFRGSVSISDFWNIENIITPETDFKLNPLQKCIIRFDPDKNFAVVLIRGKVINLVGVNENILYQIFESDDDFNGEQIMKVGDTSWEKAKAILVTMYRESISIML